ncbi:hypothetical protein N9R45_02905 [Flavobacteriaceae bacterium]|nr:hypothetical protein [Flavobacteriaceae bacterium]MDB4180240.1 hypothetical protein [Flavobacteriaceae bacterium]
MKNIFKILICSLLMVSFSCQDSENTIDTVLDYETGAILRTISVDSQLLNASDPNSLFSVTIEEQDEQDGGLLQEVRVLVELRDLTTDFTTPATGEVLVQTIPASEFSTGPVGLPRTQVNMAFGDAAAALGLPLDPQTGYNPGDIFVVKLELVLTDGRVFGASSAAGIITGGFFSSPFQYNALLTCSPMSGDYTINMFDSYGDGWQTTSAGDGGVGLTIDMDGVVTSVAMCSQWGSFDFECTPTSDGYTASTTVNIPAGTQSAIWNFPGDYYGEISVQIIAPNGVVAYESETGGTITGLLPIAVCEQ